jgi:hypothetical protein
VYESCNGHDIILLVYPPIHTWKVSASLQVQTDGECHAKSIKPMDSRTKALQQCAERRSGNCGAQESHQHVRPLLLFPQLRFKREKGNAWYAAIVVPDPRWIFVERPHVMPWQLASAFRTPRNFAFEYWDRSPSIGTPCRIQSRLFLFTRKCNLLCSTFWESTVWRHEDEKFYWRCRKPYAVTA